MQEEVKILVATFCANKRKETDGNLQKAYRVLNELQNGNEFPSLVGKIL